MASHPSVLIRQELFEKLDTQFIGTSKIQGNDSTPVELPPWRTETIAACHPPPLNGEPISPRVTQNDIVVLAGERGTWQVVAPVNGSKADIRRREGFDTRVVTAVLENVTVVRCAGSPGSNY